MNYPQIALGRLLSLSAIAAPERVVTLAKEFHRFTHSAEILFKAVDAVEETAQVRVVNGCVAHPATVKVECENRAICFPQ